MRYGSNGKPITGWQKGGKRMSRFMAQRERTIQVYCTDCQSFYDEKDVETLDISEGVQGEDRLKFKCPKGHTAESTRRG